MAGRSPADCVRCPSCGLSVAEHMEADGFILTPADSSGKRSEREVRVFVRYTTRVLDGLLDPLLPVPEERRVVRERAG